MLWEYCRDTNRSCGNPAGISFVSVATPQKCRGNENRSCGNPAGISFVSAATPQTHFRNLANDNDSSASVRIRGKQFCSMCVI